MKRFLLFIIIVFSISIGANAQVGINNTNPDSNSVLDLKSTTKGLLIPRMTSSERSIMSSFGNVPANSLMVFDTDLSKFVYYNSSRSKWLMLNPWSADENAVICYGDTSKVFKINIQPTGGHEIFKVSSSYNGIASSSSDFQTQMVITSEVLSTTGVKFNAKVSGGNFILMEGYYNSNSVFTLKSNGNLGIGYSNPSKKLEVNGDIKSTSTVTATEFVNGGAVPIGTIIMWSGDIINIPTEWALCNGSNGTPDLRGKFIVGAGSSYAVGDVGGEDQVSLTVSQLPSHNHSGSTSSDGNHWHYVARNEEKNGGGNSLAMKHTGGSNWYDYDLYRHGSDANWGESNSAGNHSHTFTSSDTGGGQNHENRPPYYTLAYIMRVN